MGSSSSQPISAIDIDVSLRTPWTPDDTCISCEYCHTSFSILKRRHHCRQCGKCACRGCTSHKAQVVGYHQPVRVCKKCYQSLKHINKVPSYLAVTETISTRIVTPTLWTHLPHVVWSIIIDMIVPHHDQSRLLLLITIRHTCRDWYHMCTQPSMWHNTKIILQKRHAQYPLEHILRCIDGCQNIHISRGYLSSAAEPRPIIYTPIATTTTTSLSTTTATSINTNNTTFQNQNQNADSLHMSRILDMIIRSRSTSTSSWWRSITCDTVEKDDNVNVDTLLLCPALHTLILRSQSRNTLSATALTACQTSLRHVSVPFTPHLISSLAASISVCATLEELYILGYRYRYATDINMPTTRTEQNDMCTGLQHFKHLHTLSLDHQFQHMLTSIAIALPRSCTTLALSINNLDELQWDDADPHIHTHIINNLSHIRTLHMYARCYIHHVISPIPSHLLSWFSPFSGLHQCSISRGRDHIITNPLIISAPIEIVIPSICTRLHILSLSTAINARHYPLQLVLNKLVSTSTSQCLLSLEVLSLNVALKIHHPTYTVTQWESIIMSLPNLRIIVIGQLERMDLIDNTARHHLLHSLARLVHLKSMSIPASSSSFSSSSHSDMHMPRADPLVLIESNRSINEDEMEWYTQYELKLQPVRYISNISQEEYRYQDDDSWITPYDNNLLNEWIACRRVRHHLVWCGDVSLKECSCTLLYHVTLSSSLVSVSQLDEVLSHALKMEMLREQRELKARRYFY